MHPESEMDWFAVRVTPRHEKVVARSLQYKGYDTLLPLYRKLARRRVTEFPLFPGYVFCRFEPFQRLPVLITPGVVQIVGIGHVPVPVDAAEMESLQKVVQAQVAAEPCPFLNVGRMVRINYGALAGVEGILLQVKNSFRLVLAVSLLHRSVQLEVDRDCVAEVVTQNKGQLAAAGAYY